MIQPFVVIIDEPEIPEWKPHLAYSTLYGRPILLVNRCATDSETKKYLEYLTTPPVHEGLPDD